MKFTLSWLKKFLDTNKNLKEITDRLTMIGLEVESVSDKSKELEAFKIVEIVSESAHPNASKLKVCSVNTGDKILQIVCGAPNARKGLRTVLAEIDTLIPNGNFKIKESEIRGVKSQGMLCSAEELNLETTSEGIIELEKDAEIGSSFVRHLGLDDPVIEISITPNRGDCLGVYGIARDLAAAGLGTLKELFIPKIDEKFKTNITAHIDENLSKIFTLREFRNIKNNESPTWLKQLLKNIGLKSISALVDITNYISYSFGRPLHIYDRDSITGDFNIRYAKENEFFESLGETKYLLGAQDIVVADNKSILSLGGIIGGAASACATDSKNIILECALFNEDILTQTGRRLKINTDARYRFERKVDPDFVVKGVALASQMIEEICGGEGSNFVVKGESDIPSHKLDFNTQKLEKLTGLNLAPEIIKDILVRLGFTVNSAYSDILSLTIPSWRSDIRIEEDVVEEILRIYGYDKLPLCPLPKIESNNLGILDAKQSRIYCAKRFLASQGLNEVISWSFCSDKNLKYFTEFSKDLKIINPISEDLNYMRPNMVINLMEILAKNQARSFENLNLFEAGPIFGAHNGLIKEEDVLTIIRSGNFDEKTVHTKKRAVDIYDIKADIENLFSSWNINFANCLLEAQDGIKYYHPGRSAIIKLGKEIIGYFGEIHPRICSEYGINAPVVAAEIFMNKLPLLKKKYGKRPIYETSSFQLVKRDFAFLIDKKIEVSEIMKSISKLDNKIIKFTQLFDIFLDPSLEDNKKSIAFTVGLQAIDRTLSEEEINQVSLEIQTLMFNKFAATVRG